MSLASDQNKPIRYAVLILHVGSVSDMGWIEMWNFLRRKLSDRRLIYPIPGWLWAPFLHLFVLPWRLIHAQMAQKEMKKDRVSDVSSSPRALGVDGGTPASTTVQETKVVSEFSSLLPTPRSISPRSAVPFSTTTTFSSGSSSRPPPPPLLSPSESPTASHSKEQKEEAVDPSRFSGEQNAGDKTIHKMEQTDKEETMGDESPQCISPASTSPRNAAPQAYPFPLSPAPSSVSVVGGEGNSTADSGARIHQTSALPKCSCSSASYIRRLCALLQQHFRSLSFEARHPQEAVQVRCAFSYQPQSIENALQQFQLLGDYSGVVDTNGRRARVREEQLLILPLFPQYRAGLTPSLFDAVLQSSLFKPSIRKVPTFHFRSSYCVHPRYIRCLERHLQRCFSETGVPYWLFIVFPSALKSFMVKDTDNVYMMECCRTFAALRQLLARPSVPSLPVKSTLCLPSWNSSSRFSETSKSIPFFVRTPTAPTPTMPRASGLDPVVPMSHRSETSTHTLSHENPAGRPFPIPSGSAEDRTPEDASIPSRPVWEETVARDVAPLASSSSSSAAVSPSVERTAPLPPTTFASLNTRSTVIPPLSFPPASVTSDGAPGARSSSRGVWRPPSSTRPAHSEMASSAAPSASVSDGAGEAGLSAHPCELPPVADELVFPANRIKLIFLPFLQGKSDGENEGNAPSTAMVSSASHPPLFQWGVERREEDGISMPRGSSVRSSSATSAPSSARTAAPLTPSLPLHLRYHPNTVLAEAHAAEPKMNAVGEWNTVDDEDEERKRRKAEGLEWVLSSRSTTCAANVHAALPDATIPPASTVSSSRLVSPTSQHASRGKCASHKVCIFCPGNAVEDEMTYLSIHRHLIPKCKRYWNHVEYIPALNDSPLHVNLLADLLTEYMIK